MLTHQESAVAEPQVYTAGIEIDLGEPSSRLLLVATYMLHYTVPRLGAAVGTEEVVAAAIR